MGWNLRGLNQVWDDFTGNSAIDKQNEFNLKMWNMQNEYNTPANQMKRYREAGLNPNLIYGGSGQMAGNATSAPEMQAHQSGVSKIMGLFQIAKNLFDLKKEKNDMDMDKLKTMSAIKHSEDTIRLENTKMLLDHIFRTNEFDWKKGVSQRDYDLRKAAHDFALEKYRDEKANIAKWGTKPGSTTDFLSKLIGYTLNRTPFEVAGDTNSMLNTVIGGMFGANKPIKEKKGKFSSWKSGYSKARYNPSDSIGFFRLMNMLGGD